MKFLLVWLALASGIACAGEMEIISLKHRSADDLLPVIIPLLDKDGAASGMNNQLILRTSVKNSAQIKKLLERIDVPPRSLRISVMQNVDSDTVARLTEVSGNIGLNRNTRLSLPDNPNTQGASIDVTQGKDHLKAKIISTHSLENDHRTQQIQVLEGKRALVSSGQSLPVDQQQVTQQQWGTQIIHTTRYQDVNSGFFVLPRVNGDIVTVEINAQNDSLTNNADLRLQQTSSVVSGHLGEWLLVGGTAQQRDAQDGTISTRHLDTRQEQRNVLIKVEEIN